MTAPSPTPADVRIGFVGCGRATTTLHLPALRRMSGGRVVAFSDPDPTRLAAAAAMCPGAAAYENYRALIEDRQVDLVAVCVPVSMHLEIAAAALAARKHVFIEKPLSLDLAECDRFIELARVAESTGIRSVVGFNLRSHRLLRQAKAIVDSGAVGEIELLRTLMTADWTGAVRPAWHAHRAHGGGALIEIGTHQVDLWRWLLGSEVESVDAAARSTEFDDQTAAFQARMTNGALVSSAVSQRSASHNLVELFGSRGTIRLSCYHADSLEVTIVGSRSSGAWRRLRPMLIKAGRIPAVLRAARGGGDVQMSYTHEWQRVLDALPTGGAMPATVEDGRQAAAIILAALRSSEERRPVAPHPMRTAMPLEARAG